MLAIPTIIIGGCRAQDVNGIFRQKIGNFIAAELKIKYYDKKSLRIFKNTGTIFGDSEEDLKHFFQLSQLFAFIIFYHQQHSWLITLDSTVILILYPLSIGEVWTP